MSWTKRQPGSATLGEVWNETKREWRLGPETRWSDLGKVFFCQSVGGLVDWGPEIFWGDFLRGDDGDDSSQMLRILLDNIGSKMASVSVSVWGKVGIFPS